jgi:hypothetical protein
MKETANSVELEIKGAKQYKVYPREDPFYYTNRTLSLSTEFALSVASRRNKSDGLAADAAVNIEASKNNVKIRKVNGILEYL